MLHKRSAADLALFGADKLFATPKSTSNLEQPDFERFLDYITGLDKVWVCSRIAVAQHWRQHVKP